MVPPIPATGPQSATQKTSSPAAPRPAGTPPASGEDIVKGWADLFEIGRDTFEITSSIAMLESPKLRRADGGALPPRASDGVPRSEEYAFSTKTVLGRDQDGEITLNGPLLDGAAPELSAWQQFCDFWIELVNFLFLFRNVDTPTFNWKPKQSDWKARAPFVLVAGGKELREKLFPAWMFSGKDALSQDERVERAATALLPMLQGSNAGARIGDLKDVATMLATELDALYAKPLSDAALKRLQREHAAAFYAGTPEYWSQRIAAEVAHASGVKDELDLASIEAAGFDGFDGYAVRDPSDRDLSEADVVEKDGKPVKWNDPDFQDARREYAKVKLGIDKVMNKVRSWEGGAPPVEEIKKLLGDSASVVKDAASRRLYSQAILMQASIEGVLASELGIFDGDKKVYGKAAYAHVITAMQADPTNVEAAVAYAIGIIAINDSSFKGIACDVLGINLAEEAKKARAALAKFPNDPRAKAKLDALAAI